MITLEEVKTAQRLAPSAPGTKSLQREYGTQLNAAREAVRKAQYLAEKEAERQEWSDLKTQIEALKLTVPEGFRLAVLSHRQAAYLGMMPKMAGGWVAVHLTLDGASEYAALLPSSCTDGHRITPSDLRSRWLSIASENEHLADILHFLSTLSKYFR